MEARQIQEGKRDKWKLFDGNARWNSKLKLLKTKLPLVRASLWQFLLSIGSHFEKRTVFFLSFCSYFGNPEFKLKISSIWVKLITTFFQIRSKRMQKLRPRVSQWREFRFQEFKFWNPSRVSIKKFSFVSLPLLKLPCLRKALLTKPFSKALLGALALWG